MAMKVAFLFVIGCATVLAAPQQLDNNLLANLQRFAAENNINVQDLYSNLQRLPQNVQNTVSSLTSGYQQPGNLQQLINPNYWQQAGSQQLDNLNNFLLPQTANVNRPPWNTNNYVLPQTANPNNYPWRNNNNNNNNYRTPILQVPNQAIDQVQHSTDDVVHRVGSALDKTWDSTQRMAENFLTHFQQLGAQGVHDGIGVAKNGFGIVSTVPKIALGMVAPRENDNA